MAKTSSIPDFLRANSAPPQKAPEKPAAPKTGRERAKAWLKDVDTPLLDLVHGTESHPVSIDRKTVNAGPANTQPDADYPYAPDRQPFTTGSAPELNAAAQTVSDSPRERWEKWLQEEVARTWEEADEDRYFYPNPYRPAWKKGLAQWDYLNYDDFENPPTHDSRTRAEATENPGFQPSTGKTRAQPGKSGHSGSVSGEQPLSATLPYHPTQPPTLQYLRGETRETPSENGGAAGWLAALATPVLDWFRGRSSDAETDNGGAARSDGGFTSGLGAGRVNPDVDESFSGGLGAERMPDTKTSDLNWAEHRWGWLLSDGEKLTRFLTDDAYRAKQELAALRGGATAQFADALYLTEEEKANIFNLAGQGLFDEALAYYSQLKDTLAQRTGQRSAEMILNVENPLLRGVATTGLGLDAGMNQSLTGLAQTGNRLTGETALLPQPSAVYANELVRPTLSGLPALASDTAYQAGFQMPGFLANQVLPGAGVLVTGAARGGATYGQRRRAGHGELTSLLAAGVDAAGIDNILHAGLQVMQENGILLPGGTHPTDLTPAPSPAADTPSTPGPNAVTSPLFPTEGAGNAGLDSDILIDSYKNLRNNPDITGQAHHLNQNAAFRDVIPKNDGLSMELEGNAFKDIGSPHYSAHENLENFWNNFRPRGDQYGGVPTISDYNSALYDSLRAAGLTDAQAKSAVHSAIKQQSQYGLADDSFVPRIPGRINFRK